MGYPNYYFYNKRCNMLFLWLYLSFFWLYNVAAFCMSMPMSFIMSENVEHSSEKTPRELMEQFNYKFHTSVISAHFFDQE